MFVYILFVILAAKTVEPFSSCDRNRFNAADSLFNSLSNDIMELDRKVQDTCKQFTTFAAREIFGMNSYRLEILLPDFQNANFVVKIKHRLIYINAHYPRQGDKCDLTYVDIKVLPEFVNAHGGAWTYSNAMFIVGFPYAHRLDDYDSSCNNQYIDETLIHPRRGFPTERIFTD